MNSIDRSARVGLITDQTGALSFMGVANVNLATMVIDDMNARGGLLGRPVELYVEDSATDDDVARAAAARLVHEADVDVVIGGIYSSTRQAIKGPVVDEAGTALPLPGAVRGSGEPPAHLLHRSGAGAADRPVHPVADGRDGGAEVLPALGRLHLAARTEPVRPRRHHAAGRRGRRRGVLPPRPHRVRDGRRRHHGLRCRGRVQHDRPARADAVPRPASRRRLHGARRNDRVHVLRRELPQPRARGARRGALRVPRLLPGGPRAVQRRAAPPLRCAVPGQRAVHGGLRVHGHVPGAQDVGVRSDRGRLARPGRRDRGA